MSKRLANFVTLDELIDEGRSDGSAIFLSYEIDFKSHLECRPEFCKRNIGKNPVY